MAGQYSGEGEDLTRSKITNAYEHIDDSDTVGARKRVQLYGRDSVSGEPVQIAATDGGALKIDGEISATIDNVGLINASDVRINPATEDKQDDIITAIGGISAGAGVDPVGLKNVAEATINPATEDKQDSLLTELQAKADLTDVQPVIARDEVPTLNNSKIELGYNAEDELIWIYKTIAGTVYKRAVTDDDYVGATTEVSITRTKTFDTWTTP